MKVSDLLQSKFFDVNANVKIFAGGQWNDGGKQVGSFSCGNIESCPKNVLDSNIIYMTVDESGCIIVECDMIVEQPLDIIKMITVSSGHVSEETFEALAMDGIRNKYGLPIYSKSAPGNSEGYGLFIYLTSGCIDEETEIPEELKSLVKLAQDNGCEVLCLDCDGPEIEGIPTYDW